MDSIKHNCRFRIPKNGKRVLWELTSRCNYRCKYCIFSCINSQNYSELSTDKIIKTLEELKQENVTHIKFTGGEPFVRNDIIQILKKTNNLKMKFDISTNASLMTEKVASELEKVKPEYVHISLDGNNKIIHEIVRGKNTFDPTIKGLKLLTSKDIYTRIGCVIHKENQDKLLEIIKLVESYNCNEIIFSFMELAGRAKENKNLLSTRSYFDIKNELDEIKKKHSFKIKINFNIERTENDCNCHAINKFLFINSVGHISPCSWVSESNSEFTTKESLENKSVHELLKSDEIEKFKSIIKSCQGCPISRK